MRKGGIYLAVYEAFARVIQDIAITVIQGEVPLRKRRLATLKAEVLSMDWTGSGPV